MKKKRSIGLLLSYGNTFFNMICGLLLSSFILRRLGDTEYGIYQTMSSFANYLVLFEFGTGTVLTRNLSASRARGESKETIEKNISTIWTITAFLSAVILAVSIAFYFSIPFVYSNTLNPEQIEQGKKIFVAIIIFLISTFFCQTLNGIALANEHYTFSSSVSILRLITRTTLLIVLLLKWKNSLIIAIVDSLIGLIIAVFTYIYCRRAFHVKINFKGFDRFILKASLPLCLALFLQTIVNQSNNSVGKFVLGVMSGPEDVALYSVALYVFGIFSSLSTIPLSLYVPQVTKDVMSGLEGLSLTKTLIQPCRLIVLVSGSVLFGFVACGRQFVDIVYGKDYSLAWLMAIILIMPSFLNMSNSVILNVLDAKNKRIVRSWFLMITTAINIVLTILGIKYFGIIAAAAATGIATILQVVIMNIYYQKAIRIKVMYLFKHIFKGILPYQILAALLGYLSGAFISNMLVSFLVAGITYVIVFVMCFSVFGKNEEEKLLFKNFVRKLKKSK